MSPFRTGIVTSPLGESGRTPLSNLVEVVADRCGPVYLVTGNAGLDFFHDSTRTTVSGIRHREGYHPLSRIVRNAHMQLRLALLVVRHAKFVDTWIFFFGGDGLVIPMVIAKLTGKNALLALPASEEQMLRAADDRFYKLVRVVSDINRRLSTRLVVYTWRLVNEWHLERYRSKISIAHHHFVDFTRFRPMRRLKDRENLVGYVGRMNEEKGVLQFVRAIPEAIKRDPTLGFVIAGDGPLGNTVREYIGRLALGETVRMTGWITHSDLPSLLNELKLIVIPSYTEGWPSVMLEAMACGTPVLATPVGGIPDVIREGETGFMMENNSPESIASNVIRVLESSDLEQVAERANAYVQGNFTFEKAADSWRRVIEGPWTAARAIQDRA